MLSLDIILPVLVSSFVALFSYLVKSYFKKIHETLDCLRQSLSKLEGNLDILNKEIRQNTVEGAGLRSEVRAIWRFVDNAHKRASDGGEA